MRIGLASELANKAVGAVPLGVPCLNSASNVYTHGEMSLESEVHACSKNVGDGPVKRPLCLKRMLAPRH